MVVLSANSWLLPTTNISEVFRGLPGRDTEPMESSTRLCRWKLLSGASSELRPVNRASYEYGRRGGEGGEVVSVGVVFKF